MLLLGFLLLSVAMTLGNVMQNHAYILTIDNNILMNIRVIKHSSDLLDLSNLSLKFINEEAFSHLRNLKTLNLANNSLKVLPEFIFANLTNLEYLNLADNALKSGYCYNGLGNLKILNISNNPLFLFEPSHFYGLNIGITVIVTQGLSLSWISAAMFQSHLTLDISPPKDAAEDETHDDNDPGVEPYDNYTSFNPNSELRYKACFRNDRLTSLEELKKNEILANNCYEVDRFDDSLRIDELGIKALDDNWYRVQDRNVIALYLDHNDIVRVTSQLLNDLSRDIVQVSLQGNLIERLERGIIENNNSIELLDLSENIISEIEDGALEKLNLTSMLALDGNQLNNTRFMDSLPLNICNLSLSHNNISEISVGDFSKFTTFFSLDLNYNIIQEVKAHRLRGFSSLSVLKMRNNSLTTIEPGFFQDLKNLLSLDLKSNKLTSLENGVFSGLWNIEDINLSSNKLKNIASGVFSGLTSLRSLYLGRNKIETLWAGTFINLPMIDLHLERNKISEIERQSLVLPSLERLYLHHNSLSVIDVETFIYLRNLNLLSLSSNNITTIKKWSFQNLNNLSTVDLSNNPIKILEKNAFFGIPKTVRANIKLVNVPVEIIQSGLFGVD